jgi:hypothetical protein
MHGLWSRARLKNFYSNTKSGGAFFRRRGIRLVVYLDDFFIWNESEGGTRTDLKIIVLNWDKSVITPAQTIEYLGMVVHSNKLSFSLL